MRTVVVEEKAPTDGEETRPEDMTECCPLVQQIERNNQNKKGHPQLHPPPEHQYKQQQSTPCA
jgi:hypothetical protein